MPVACGVGRAKRMVKRFKGFKGLTPRKRSGLGVACACGIGRAKRLFKRFNRLNKAGERQARTPIRSY